MAGQERRPTRRAAGHHRGSVQGPRLGHGPESARGQRHGIHGSQRTGGARVSAPGRTVKAFMSDLDEREHCTAYARSAGEPELIELAAEQEARRILARTEPSSGSMGLSTAYGALSPLSAGWLADSLRAVLPILDALEAEARATDHQQEAR